MVIYTYSNGYVDGSIHISPVFCFHLDGASQLAHLFTEEVVELLTRLSGEASNKRVETARLIERER